MRTPLLVCALLLAACSSDGPANDDAAQVEPVDSSTTTSAAPSTTATDAAPEETVPEEPPMETDFGAPEGVVRVGLSADLTGPAASLMARIVDGQLAYFESANTSGLLGDLTIEPIVLNNAGDVATHVDNVREFAEASDNGVAVVSLGGNEDQALAVASILEDADMAAVPYSWLSSARRLGGTSGVFAVDTSNYCTEAIHGVEYLMGTDESTPVKIALIGRAGAYGRDSTDGARQAAEALGAEIVLDRVEEFDEESLRALATELVEVGPDVVWVALSPAQLARLLVWSVDGGLAARWSGSGLSYTTAVLETSAANAFDGFYWPSFLTAPWGTEGASADAEAAIAVTYPDLTYADAAAVALGWRQAERVADALAQAASEGDLTRANIATLLTQPAADEPAASYLFDIDLSTATPALSVSEEGSTGLIPIEPTELQTSGATC